ncbi:hypothetical protein NDU88_006383 [Pleurodeles waltl]|uniref:Uncharacterized protein n=1 Tax=Pleurodeles waltl TaxID=8319 RepID=A0AAV7UNU2_PLEWA|nr:hypothetical protein NDU88_006383 [Pleurodeles waltl]
MGMFSPSPCLLPTESEILMGGPVWLLLTNRRETLLVVIVTGTAGAPTATSLVGSCRKGVGREVARRWAEGRGTPRPRDGCTSRAPGEGAGDTAWIVRRSTKSEAASSDSGDSQTPVMRKRHRREGVTAPGEDTGMISGSPHPLVVAINRLETEETDFGAKGGIQTVEAAQ